MLSLSLSLSLSLENEFILCSNQGSTMGNKTRIQTFNPNRRRVNSTNKLLIRKGTN